MKRSTILSIPFRHACTVVMQNTNVSSLIIAAARQKSLVALSELFRSPSSSTSSSQDPHPPPSTPSRAVAISADAAFSMCSLIQAGWALPAMSEHFVAPWHAALWMLEQSSITDMVTWRTNIIKNYVEQIEHRMIDETMMGAVCAEKRRDKKSNKSKAKQSSDHNTLVSSALWSASLKLIAVLRAHELMEWCTAATVLALCILLQQQQQQQHMTTISCPSPWVEALHLFSRLISVQQSSHIECSRQADLAGEIFKREIFTRAAAMGKPRSAPRRRKEVGGTTQRVSAASLVLTRDFGHVIGETPRKLNAVRQHAAAAGKQLLLIVLDSNIIHRWLTSSYSFAQLIAQIVDEATHDEAPRTLMPVVLIPLAVVEEVWNRAWRRASTAQGEQIVAHEKLTTLFSADRTHQSAEDYIASHRCELASAPPFSLSPSSSASLPWILVMNFFDAVAASVFLADDEIQAQRDQLRADLFGPSAHNISVADRYRLSTTEVDLQIAQQYLYVKKFWPARRVVLATSDHALAQRVRDLGGDVVNTVSHRSRDRRDETK